MRKITLFIVMLCITAWTYGQTPMSGTYKVGITETSPNFASLSAAVTALNANGVSGDVILEITSDITEAANIGLGVDTKGFSITIRPDQDVERTITFTKTTDNTSPSGHFVIGYTSLTTAWSDANTIATNNVTIDGYAEGGSTRRLKFTTASASIVASKLTVILGGCQNTTIKNCIYESKSTGTSAQCIGMVARKGTAIEVAPKSILIENNIMTSITSVSGQGINTTSSGTLTTAKTIGLVVRNNVITAQGRCAWLYYCNGGEFAGNEFNLTQLGSSGTVNYGLWFGTGVAGTFNISRNKILLLTTKEASASGNFGTRGLSLAGGCTYNINNNTFAGIDRLATAVASVNQCYIFVSGTGYIYNNTFYMPPLTVGATPGYYNSLQVYDGTNTYVKNNIFIANDDQKAVIISGVTKESDYNVFYLRAGNTNAKILGAYATLDAYQSAESKDVNSKSFDVTFTNESAGDLTLSGASSTDLRLAVPALEGVTTDIFGISNTRHTPNVYVGAHEPYDINQTKTFTVQAPVGTDHVYIAGSFPGKSWDITAPYELQSTATPYQFTGTFLADNAIAYKYLNGINNWNYLEATAPATELNVNRSYNASDNIPYWKAMPKVKLNVTINAASGVPANLFVKGSWDSWATGIALTASSTPLTSPAQKAKSAINTISYTGVIGNGTTDVIYSNTEYKYYTTDQADPNWEADPDGTGLDNNRRAIYPLMDNEIARFMTQIATGLGEMKDVEVRIMRTANGINVVFEGNADIELYGINGMMLDKTNATGNYSKTLQNGIYVLKVNGKSIKFIK